MIIVSAMTTLQIEGAVNASGYSPDDIDTSVSEGQFGIGAGAGAGGSIQLHSREIVGSGSIIANGGDIGKELYGGVGMN